MDRIEKDVAALRKRFPDLEFGDPWVLLPTYPLPISDWGAKSVRVAFQIPPGYPGQKPYGFHVCPRLKVAAANPTNATESTEPPFEGEWLKFSWDCPEWNGADDASEGSTLLHWALSFHERLKEYN
jgi:hypothetical protein